MPKIDKKQKREMCEIIKDLRGKGHSRTFTLKEIKNKLGISCCLRTIQNYELVVFSAGYLEKLKQDNLMMAKWKEEYFNNKVVTLNEKYAEDLFKLASGKLDKDDFDSNLLS